MTPSRLPTRFLLAACAALGMLLGGVSPAVAGTYVTYSCKTPAGAAAPTADWVLTRTNPSSTLTSACPAGPLTLELAPGTVHAASDSARINFRAPVDTEIRGYSIYRSARLGPRYNLWRYDTGIGVVERCHTTDGSCTAVGNGAEPLSGANLVRTADRTGIKGIEFKLTCGEDDTHATTCASANPAGIVQIHRADFTFNDSFAPRIDGVSGPLVETRGELTGAQPVWIAASDRGGGVYRATLEVDGRAMASAVLDGNRGLCTEPFVVAQPCALRASGALELDTTQLADGPHALKLRVTDATSTNVAEWGPQQIVTSNASCSPSPRIDAMKLFAGLGGGTDARGQAIAPRRTRTVAHGAQMTLRGTLASPLDAPAVGARVCLLGREDRPGAALTEIGVTTTDGNGSFSFAVPTGPSRELVAVHRVPGGAVVASAQLKVKAAVTLTPSRKRLRNGGRVALRGKLVNGPLPDRGVLVELQAKRGRKWQTFGTTRSGRDGTYQLRYRFTRTTGVQRYTMRALVAEQSAYPYVRGASKPITLRVSAR